MEKEPSELALRRSRDHGVLIKDGMGNSRAGGKIGTVDAINMCSTYTLV